MTPRNFLPAPTALRRGVALLLAATLSAFAAAQAPATPVAPAAPTAAPSPILNGIAHIALRVKDIPASVDFYHKLGFDQAFAMTTGAVTTESFIKINDRQFIELYPVTGSDTRIGFLHLCFEAADINALHDYYVGQGLSPTAVRKAGAGNMLFTMNGQQQVTGPQNMEYTQYMPGSLHSKDFGQHLGPDRVGDRMTVVALAMQDPAATQIFYLDKLAFTQTKDHAARMDLPGKTGEQVEIVTAAELGLKSSIILTTPDIDKSAAQLTRQQVAFQRAGSNFTDAQGKTTHIEMISVTDPDGNIIRIQAAPNSK